MFLGILWHVCVSTYTDMYGVYNVPYQHQIRPVLAHTQLPVSEKKILDMVKKSIFLEHKEIVQKYWFVD